jgi:hypothetical protein
MPRRRVDPAESRILSDLDLARAALKRTWTRLTYAFHRHQKAQERVKSLERRLRMVRIANDLQKKEGTS